MVAEQQYPIAEAGSVELVKAGVDISSDLADQALDYIATLEHQGIEPGAYKGANVVQVAASVVDFLVWLQAVRGGVL